MTGRPGVRSVSGAHPAIVPHAHAPAQTCRSCTGPDRRPVVLRRACPDARSALPRWSSTRGGERRSCAMRSATCTGTGTSLVEALRAAGLVDAAGDWSGDDATLWVLGDYVDRGPDGVGVVDVVMRLQQQAPRSGGRVGALMGNHEVLALGHAPLRRRDRARRRRPRARLHHQLGAERRPPQRPGAGSPPSTWRGWPRSLPSPVTATGCSPTPTPPSTSAGAARWRRSTPRVAGVTAAGDLEAWWDLWRGLTTRFAFRGPGASPPPRR